MGIQDRVVERRAMTFTCDQCHCSETRTYDDLGAYRPLADEVPFDHDWLSVTFGNRERVEMTFCSRTCADLYVEKRLGPRTAEGTLREVV